MALVVWFFFFWRTQFGVEVGLQVIQKHGKILYKQERENT